MEKIVAGTQSDTGWTGEHRLQSKLLLKSVAPFWSFWEAASGIYALKRKGMLEKGKGKKKGKKKAALVIWFVSFALNQIVLIPGLPLCF